MLLDRLDMGCTGSRVVAEAREIPWLCPNRRRALVGRFPTADFVFTPMGALAAPPVDWPSMPALTTETVRPFAAKFSRSISCQVFTLVDVALVGGASAEG